MCVNVSECVVVVVVVCVSLDTGRGRGRGGAAGAPAGRTLVLDNRPTTLVIANPPADLSGDKLLAHFKARHGRLCGVCVCCVCVSVCVCVCARAVMCLYLYASVAWVM